MLEEAGYVVITVESPFGLSSALTREQPDVVLVDVTMPGLSGDKLVEITLRKTSDAQVLARELQRYLRA